MPDMATAPVQERGYASNGSSFWAFDDETTPELRWPLNLLVYDRMRRQDAQVGSVLRAVTLPVRRTTWRVDPNGANERVVQHVAQDLGLPIAGRSDLPASLGRQRDRFSWAEHLRHALLELVFGHMFFEQVYRIGDDGLAHLRKLGPRMPRTLAGINVAPDGGLLSIEQHAVAGSPSNTVTIGVERLVAYVHDREAGDWRGVSLLRDAYKNWLIKDPMLRVQAQTVERNGMGVPVYIAQEGASAADIAAGAKIAQSYRSGDAAGAALPFGAQLHLLGVEGVLPDADKVIRYHDEQIARAVLAHFLNLGTQTGSWALGSTFADFFTMSLQTLAQQIADVATQHIVEDLVDANYGVDEPAPRVVFDEIGSRQAFTAEVLKSLVDAGILRPDQVLEEFVRQSYSLPPKAIPGTPTAAPDPNGPPA